MLTQHGMTDVLVNGIAVLLQSPTAAILEWATIQAHSLDIQVNVIAIVLEQCLQRLHLSAQT